MKNLISKAAILITATLFALVAVAPANAQSTVIRANVPFEFHAGDQMLPAGQYQFTLDPLTKRIAVQAIEGSGVAIVAAGQYKVQTRDEGVSLTFNKYGDAYFLRAVTDGNDVAYHWGPSKKERSVSRSLNVEIAYLRPATR